jgi:hypothetical protein
MNLNVPYVLAIVMAINLTACGKKSETPHKAKEQMQIDAQLLKVDMDLAMLEMDLRTSQTVDCVIANSMKNLEAKNKIVEEMKTAAAGECAIAGELVEATKSTFEALKSAGSVNSPLFIFSIYKAETEGSKEQRVGVFSSVEQCTELEQHAHDLGMPTSKCKEWKSLLKPIDDSSVEKK